MPVAKPPRIILDRGLRPALQHFDRAAWRFKAAEKRRGHGAGREGLRCCNRPQIAKIRLRTIERRRGERVLQALDGILAVSSGDDNLRDHGIVERHDLRAVFDPCLDARCLRRRKAGARKLARRRLKILSPDLQRRCGPRSTNLAVRHAGSPAAEARRLPHGSSVSTRSRPVTCSVTPCSTCSRVFTSRK